MKKIAIIGGGVAGLSAGIYALKSGFACDIYEQHICAGGQCTSWKRKGFHIDNCVHWLTGTNPQKEVYQVWKELNVLGDEVEIIQNESFLHLESNGQSLDLWQDTKRMRQDMLALSPVDADAINTFVDEVETYMLMDMPALKPIEQLSIKEFWHLLKKLRPVGKVHRKLSKISLQQYAKRFKHPLLQKMMLAYMPATYNVSSWLFVLGTFCSGNGALPRGGSEGITNRMVDLFLSLGGTIHTRKRAVNLTLGKKQVESVQFSDGSVAYADYYIMACDTSVVFQKLLPAKYVDKFFAKHYSDKKAHPVYSSFNTYIAVDADTSFLGDTTWFDCEPYWAVGKVQQSVLLKNFITEPTFAPAGKNIFQTLLVQYEDDFNRWEDLYLHNLEQYKEAKHNLANYVVKRIEQQYPQLAGKMEVVETVSPYSFYRFCGAYKGSYMSFILTPFAPKQTSKGRVKGLSNLYLSGQWLQPPGGLPNAAVTGRFTIQRLCKDLKRPFNAQ